MKSIYLIGSLRNPKVPELANQLRDLGFDVFDDWFHPGPRADTFLLKYERGRGHTYAQALKSLAAKHIFEFDLHHVTRCDIGVMLMPTGRSGHLELGFMRGQGKPGYILFDKEPDRFDVMYQFATEVFFDRGHLFDTLRREL